MKVPPRQKLEGGVRQGRDVLSMIAGNPRRRLLSPLQLTTAISIDESNEPDTPGQILVSAFQDEACKDDMSRVDPSSTSVQVTPKTIAVLNDTGDSVWLPGCGQNGVGPNASLPPDQNDPPNSDSFMQLLVETRSKDGKASLGALSGKLNDIEKRVNQPPAALPAQRPQTEILDAILIESAK